MHLHLRSCLPSLPAKGIKLSRRDPAPKTKSKTVPNKKTRTLSSSSDEDFSMIEDIDSFQKIEALEKTVNQDQLAVSSQEPAGRQ